MRGITINNVQPGPTDTDMNPASGEFAKEARKYIVPRLRSERLAYGRSHDAAPGRE